MKQKWILLRIPDFHGGMKSFKTEECISKVAIIQVYMVLVLFFSFAVSFIFWCFFPVICQKVWRKRKQRSRKTNCNQYYLEKSWKMCKVDLWCYSYITRTVGLSDKQTGKDIWGYITALKYVFFEHLRKLKSKKKMQQTNSCSCRSWTCRHGCCGKWQFALTPLNCRCWHP